MHIYILYPHISTRLDMTRLCLFADVCRWIRRTGWVDGWMVGQSRVTSSCWKTRRAAVCWTIFSETFATSLQDVTMYDGQQGESAQNGFTTCLILKSHGSSGAWCLKWTLEMSWCPLARYSQRFGNYTAQRIIEHLASRNTRGTRTQRIPRVGPPLVDDM